MSDKCTHKIREKESACANGLCPICLASDLVNTKLALAESIADRDRLVRCLTDADDRNEKLSAELAEYRAKSDH